MINNEVTKKDDFSPPEKTIILPIKETSGQLKKGDNLLIDSGKEITLLKYEDISIEANYPLTQRVNRHTSVVCLGNILRPYWALEGEGKRKWEERRDNHPFTHKDPSKRITRQLKANFLGTHRIDFRQDEEFEISLVSSDNSDIYLNLANKYANGEARKVFDTIELIADDN